ncbi:hypothetical protein EWM64_g4948 [Hericium alpestre]|uniref:Tc1-like transposase DDE domain-containing protein n=1 Tax=Hericium alpestre TaxID=135208 RepID=A0A4Y9ZXY9_9AGAM|nr:hypothetical protein EWM64_g4948 [Hericium alpestre]
MVFRKIDPGIKWRTIELLEDGWGEDEIILALNVSRDSIRRWTAYAEQHGSVVPPHPHQGRPRLLNATIIEDMRSLLLDLPSLYLDEIVAWLAVVHDISISVGALHNTLSAIGLIYKRLHKSAAQRDPALCAMWRATTTLNYAAAQYVFIDESSFDGRNLERDYGRAAVGQRANEVMPHERGQRYSLLPALTLDGYIATRVVSGSVNGLEFYDFVARDLVCSELILSAF